MDVFNTIEMNGVAIKVDNETDYYLDEWLYSDYGFRMFYKPTKGSNEYYWLKNLKKYKFDETIVYKRLMDIETRKRSLRIQDFITRNYLLQFISHSNFYSLFFDYREGMIIMRNGEQLYHLL